MHRHYPVSLVVTGQPCLVVGGGTVAGHKADGLVRAGARVTILAPSVDREVDRLAIERRIAVERREYRVGDAAGYRLVITATGLPAVDSQVAADAEANGVWVNSADDPAHCTFTLPAIHWDGKVSMAVSTGGASPALASWLRDLAAGACGRGLDDLATLLDDARQEVKSSGRPTSAVDWRSLLDGPLPDLVRRGRLKAARDLIDDATD